METRYVRLHELTPDNDHILYELRSDPEFLATCTSREPISLETFKKEIKKEFEENRNIQFLIEEKSSSAFVGTVYAYEERKEDAYISTTIFLQSAARDKGYGPQALALMLRFLFVVRDIYKIYMDVYETNSMSLQLLRRSLFQQEGRFRRQHRIGDERCDVLRFAAFSEDLTKIEEALASWA